MTHIGAPSTRGRTWAPRPRCEVWRQQQRQGRLKNTRLDLLLFHYVTLRKHEPIKVSHVFQEFKNWWRKARRGRWQRIGAAGQGRQLFRDVRRAGTENSFCLFCRRMLLLDTSTPMPAAHAFLRGPQAGLPGLQTSDDRHRILRGSAICVWIHDKSYNRVFVERLLTEMVQEGSHDPALLREKLLGMSGLSQIWPNDDVFAPHGGPIVFIRGQARCVFVRSWKDWRWRCARRGKSLCRS